MKTGTGTTTGGVSRGTKLQAVVEPVPVFISPPPAPLILGIVAIQDIRKHPQRHGLGRAIFGLIMGLVGTAFLLLAIATAVWGSR